MIFLEPGQSPRQTASWPTEVDTDMCIPPAPVPSTKEALETALQQIDALEFEVRRGATEHQRMWAHISRLERQLGTLLAAQLDRRDDLAGTQHCEHQELSRQTRTLIEQQFQNFARQYSDRTDLDTDRPRRERTAHLMSMLIRQLLDKRPASSWSIQQSLRLGEDPGIEAVINRLRTDCVTLTERISKVGLAHEWGYAHAVGAPLDSGRQEAWASCDPDAPISFLVAPAYLVNGRIYSRQLVYTV
ncbi:hypothetical protein FGW37_29860 [Streptomyces rectiverticillatus]|uniref:hypothetical protein n=1 Tax=Streptomyces rectiverticillatus TaxID=173860 RepID=UPI0015C3A5B7|nr:hypothetical protein [Streptomyces rectiverticillatus]QLE75247.1 hypothetical protein FGW37_29860 [Streptomyces rectiverticillatus]